MKIVEWIYYKSEEAKSMKEYTFWNYLYRIFYWSIFNKGNRK